MKEDLITKGAFLKSDNISLKDKIVAVSNQIEQTFSQNIQKTEKKTGLFTMLDKKTLLHKLSQETEPRITVSLYKYQHLNNLPVYRAELYKEWEDLNVLGRIYIAEEGIINAQMSVPRSNLELLRESVARRFPGTPFKYAIENGQSFLKLTVKVRKKILADGQEDHSYDVTNVGKHLNAEQWNEAMDQKIPLWLMLETTMSTK